MIVYRLSREKYKNDISGKGAEIAGGRWNSKGIALLYTSQNRALCTTEIAVHVPFGIVPKDYYMITIKIPGDYIIEEVNKRKLAKGWSKFPYHKSTKTLGDKFVKENNSLILKVPSAVVQGEYNYLVNPTHEDFNQVKVIEMEPFKFDQRLFRKG